MQVGHSKITVRFRVARQQPRWLLWIFVAVAFAAMLLGSWAHRPRTSTG